MCPVIYKVVAVDEYNIFVIYVMGSYINDFDKNSPFLCRSGR